ncbi:MAG: sigma-70 family RNA polymerase sigma factor [Intrasporangium sp.]|uniref:sigma-70 family RNA polymerase sigma factor n=1 Tax=Intrasporangium sp. TaxID=1925024 RepID=UPI003F7DAA63
MNATPALAEEFEENRDHLARVAMRLLGSPEDAEDAVQEAWFRLERTDRGSIDNLRAWLTTVVSRVSLDLLRSRSARREEPDGEAVVESLGASASGDSAADPAARAELADSVSVALLVVLESLGPSERLAFVLHDLFAIPFDEVASVLDTSPAAARQLASRARRRVHGGDPTGPSPSDPAHREVVTAFLDASQGGDLTRLVELLHPDAVLRSDVAAAAMGSPALVGGGSEVADFFCGKAKAARRVLVDGAPAAVWSLHGVPKVAFLFTLDDATGQITAIDLVADPDRLATFTIESMARTRTLAD